MQLKRRLYVLTASLAAVFFSSSIYADVWYQSYHIEAMFKCAAVGIPSGTCYFLYDPFVFITGTIGFVVMLITTRWLLLKLFPRLMRRV